MTWMECIKLGKPQIIKLLNKNQIPYSHIPSGRGSYFKLCSLVHNYHKNNKEQNENITKINQSSIHSTTSIQNIRQESQNSQALPLLHQETAIRVCSESTKRASNLETAIQRMVTASTVEQKLSDLDRAIRLAENSDCEITRRIGGQRRKFTEIAIGVRNVQIDQQQIASDQQRIKSDCERIKADCDDFNSKLERASELIKSWS